jgi:hypothetical protein
MLAVAEEASRVTMLVVLATVAVVAVVELLQITPLLQAVAQAQLELFGFYQAK